jgi:hypothetical protein
MIRTEDVRELIHKRPFEPFRICMTDGRTYDTTHPELCLPGRTKVHVAVPDPREKRLIMRVDQCVLVHIVRFEPLDGNRRRAPRGRNRRLR